LVLGSSMKITVTPWSGSSCGGPTFAPSVSRYCAAAASRSGTAMATWFRRPIILCPRSGPAPGLRIREDTDERTDHAEIADTPRLRAGLPLARADGASGRRQPPRGGIGAASVPALGRAHSPRRLPALGAAPSGLLPPVGRHRRCRPARRLGPEADRDLAAARPACRRCWRSAGTTPCARGAGGRGGRFPGTSRCAAWRRSSTRSSPACPTSRPASGRCAPSPTVMKVGGRCAMKVDGTHYRSLWWDDPPARCRSSISAGCRMISASDGRHLDGLCRGDPRHVGARRAADRRDGGLWHGAGDGRGSRRTPAWTGPTTLTPPAPRRSTCAGRSTDAARALRPLPRRTRAAAPGAGA
jgi:hypothetical protein